MITELNTIVKEWDKREKEIEATTSIDKETGRTIFDPSYEPKSIDFYSRLIPILEKMSDKIDELEDTIEALEMRLHNDN